LVLGLIVLDGLKWVEKRRKQDRHATLTIAVAEGGPTEDEVAASLNDKGYEVGAWAASYINPGSQRQLKVEVRWRAYPQDVRPPSVIRDLAHRAGVVKVAWIP